MFVLFHLFKFKFRVLKDTFYLQYKKMFSSYYLENTRINGLSFNQQLYMESIDLDCIHCQTCFVS